MAAGEVAPSDIAVLTPLSLLVILTEVFAEGAREIDATRLACLALTVLAQGDIVEEQ